MDDTAVRALLTPEGLRLLDEVGPLEAKSDVVRLVSRLRAAGHPPARVAAVVEQARLRTRARSKFGDFTDRLLFTADGLEQATRLRVAAVHAGRFAASGVESVADLGCGIGADSLALAGLGIAVTAVERDEATAALAAYNLAPFPNARVVHGEATTVGLDGVAGLWLDPARRSGGERHADPADWSPSLDWAFARARERPTGIKLAPGVDRRIIPDGVEAQWVSVDREVVELVLWSGALARPGVARAALVLGPHGAAELTGASDAADAELRPLGRFLVEPDGAVIRARLIGDLARRLDGGMIDPTIAWITTDREPATPLGQSFRVIARYPLDAKTLKRELGPRYASLEIKKRGVDVDPAAFRTRLGLRGEGAATLILTRIAGERAALLAERL